MVMLKLLPSQKVTGPDNVIVAEGAGLTVILTEAALVTEQPKELVILTVYVPVTLAV